HAREEHIGRRGEHVPHPGDSADSQEERRDRADNRPWARIHEVIVVVRLGVGVGHFQRLRLWRATRIVRALFVVPSMPDRVMLYSLFLMSLCMIISEIGFHFRDHALTPPRRSRAAALHAR